MSLPQYSGHFTGAIASVTCLPVLIFGIVAGMWQFRAEFELNRKDARRPLSSFISFPPSPTTLLYFRVSRCFFATKCEFDALCVLCKCTTSINNHISVFFGLDATIQAWITFGSTNDILHASSVPIHFPFSYIGFSP
jgi:hypothetical protein